MNILLPITHGMIPVKTDRVIDPNAFEIRSLLNRSMAKMAREGINFTQALFDAEAAKIRAEVEAR